MPLPLPLHFIIAMIADAINERMARQLDYLLEEVRVLRQVYSDREAIWSSREPPIGKPFGAAVSNRGVGG